MTIFEATTALVAEDEGRFRGEADPRWASLHGLHGGYRVALAVRAAMLTHPHRAVRTVSASFLRPGAPGPVTVQLTAVRDGRTFTTTDATVEQDGAQLLRCRITATTATGGHQWSTPPADPPAPIARCVAFEIPAGIAHFQHADLLLDPDHLPREGGDRARVAGYIRPAGAAGQALDAAWLAMAGDWFPPAAFGRLAPPSGGVSIDYTVHVHATRPPLGPDEWVAGAFEVRTSRDGIGLETGYLATTDGVPLIETFHTRLTA